MIKVYLKGQQTEWDLFLGCLAGAYRSSTHQSTGFTPNMLMLGKEIRLPTEIVFGSLDNTGETISSYGSYVEFIRERMHRAHGIAQKQLASSAKRQKESYDLREKNSLSKQGTLIGISMRPNEKASRQSFKIHIGDLVLFWKN